MRSNFSAADLARLALTDMKPGLPDTRSARPVKSFVLAQTGPEDAQITIVTRQRATSRVEQGCARARSSVIHDDRRRTGEGFVSLDAQRSGVSSVAFSNAVPASREVRRSGVICFFCEDVAGAKRAAVGG
jgi:hypothetical protein